LTLVLKLDDLRHSILARRAGAKPGDRASHDEYPDEASRFDPNGVTDGS
jgi:hypothetical protein